MAYVSMKILIVCGLATLVAYWYISARTEAKGRANFARQHGCQPIKNNLRGKWPLSLDLLKVQYAAAQRNQLFDFLQPYFDKYGPTFSINIVGEGLCTIDPANVEAITISKFDDWGLGTRRRGVFPFIGEVDLAPAFFSFTLGTTTDLLFGESLDTLSRDDQKDFSNSFDHATKVTALRLRLAELCWVYTPPSFMKSCRTVKKFASHFVRRALACQKQQGNAAKRQYSFILDLYEKINSQFLVSDQLVNVLLAGRDTTAASLTWTFFHLLRNPEKLQRLKREIDSVTQGDSGITKQHIQQMPYLSAVWTEILRLYPQIPMNVRFATRHTWLPKGGGPDGEMPIFVPKHSGCGISVYHMHRRKDLYGEDANGFRPERWLSGELKDIKYGYMPFWHGQRICLGKDFATLEASYLIVRLLQAYPDMHLPQDHAILQPGKEKQDVGIVVASTEGCKVVLR
ncbi:hypothetical protein OHC33_001584 [Knufia fluminis]|uniref:Cytochrome P450 n=1 Tax=Knufia fluminis TaxID=191047 RepID=A0AAN8EK40_9EURO|nr:hypothetical protein OHC33_001584 [Knufia fluminis]